MSTLGKAVAIAAKAHMDKTDNGGQAYIMHPIRLVMRLRTRDEELMSIAILHDVIEDSEWTLEMLEHEGFSKRVVNALAMLTHEPEDSYEEYIRKISTNMDAILVKLEDLRDNSDITRLKGLRYKDIERVRKYHKAHVFLTKCLNTNKEIYGQA